MDIVRIALVASMLAAFFAIVATAKAMFEKDIPVFLVGLMCLAVCFYLVDKILNLLEK